MNVRNEFYCRIWIIFPAACHIRFKALCFILRSKCYGEGKSATKPQRNRINSTQDTPLLTVGLFIEDNHLLSGHRRLIESMRPKFYKRSVAYASQLQRRSTEKFVSRFIPNPFYSELILKLFLLQDLWSYSPSLVTYA